ncbi:MAG: RHS repeat domain-containing protein, partial [Anaerolineales bacterium]
AHVVKYQHTDALGSPAAVSNQAGAVIDRTNYDPYGGAINKTVDAIGYTGHVMDPVTGLTYMQQRYYDSEVGVFLSVDPVSPNANTGHNFNRYRYANSNPYAFVDPDGRLSMRKHKTFCEIVEICVSGHRSRRDTSSVKAADKAQDDYGKLASRIIKEAEDKNAIPKLSVNDIRTISNYMVMKAKRQPRHLPLTDAYMSQFIGFDTFIFKEGLAGRKFDVEGHGIANGGDINYIGVGALIAAYGERRAMVPAVVAAWNRWQYMFMGQNPHD